MGHYIKNKTFDSYEEKKEDKYQIRQKRKKIITKQIGSTLTHKHCYTLAPATPDLPASFC
jgi:hypothetical protein